MLLLLFLLLLLLLIGECGQRCGSTDAAGGADLAENPAGRADIVRMVQEQQTRSSAQRRGHDASLQPRQFLDRPGDSQRIQRPLAGGSRLALHPHRQEAARAQQPPHAVGRHLSPAQRPHLPAAEDVERRAQKGRPAHGAPRRSLLRPQQLGETAPAHGYTQTALRSLLRFKSTSFNQDKTIIHSIDINLLVEKVSNRIKG